MQERRGGAEEQVRVVQQVRVVEIPSVAWLCLGLVIGNTVLLCCAGLCWAGSLCGGPWLTGLLDWARGYRWNHQDRCILETPTDTGYRII